MRLESGRMSIEPTQLDQSSRQGERLIEWIFLGAVITMAYMAVPSWLLRLAWYSLPEDMRTEECWTWFRTWFLELLCLGFAGLLVCGSPKRSGLRIGSLSQHWRGVLVVCGIPIALTAAVFPFLPERPFSDHTFHMWLTSPWHEDLVFAGFLYGRFEQVAPSYVHRKIRIRWALVLTAVFFSSMHLPWFMSASVGYVTFMLAYTFVGLIIIGLSRQWTGSLLYGVLAHMAINLIAWAAS